MTATEQQLTEWGFSLKSEQLGLYTKMKDRQLTIEFYLNDGNPKVFLNAILVDNCTSLPSLQVLLHLFDMI